MPDWAMILIKCALWVGLGHGMVVIVTDCVRRQVTHWFIEFWPVIAAVTLAALEGWITA